MRTVKKQTKILDYMEIILSVPTKIRKLMVSSKKYQLWALCTITRDYDQPNSKK